jgi:hypothetical protein
VWGWALALCLLALPLAASPGAAQEDLDEILGGFEDDAEVEAELEEVSEVADQAPTFWELGGQLSLGTSFNYLPHESAVGTDYQGLSRLRSQLALRLDVNLPRSWTARVDGFAFYDFAYLAHGRDAYTDDVLEMYEWDAELQDTYVQGTPHERIDLRIGRQIVNWGRSDTLRVLDVINPIDNREPGLADIENLRRAVTLVRADGYLGDWGLSLLVIPEVRFDLQPAYGSDFNPSPAPFPKDAPDHWGDAPEYGGALTGVFRGWDVSLHAGRFWQNTPRLDADPVRLVYDRFTLVGAGGNYTLGNWLLKGELAWIDGVGFFNAGDTSRVDAMAGVEYYGIEETVIALEVVNRHIVDFESAIESAPDFARRNELELALRITVDLMNERLHLLGLGAVRGERAQDGAFVRLSASYDLRDALELSGGILIFAEGDDPPTSTWGDNDRLFAELVWDF